MIRLKRTIPYVVVFITSMGIMIVELVASRIVSKYFGSSLYTWTGVIGIVLGGISLGNYLGGKLADRYSPKKTISLLLLITSFFIFLILILDSILDRIMSRGEFSIVTASMVLRSVINIFVLFFLPSTALGTISPVMAKYALEGSSRVGNIVGSIYAIASIGSIIGTFLSGFVLIPLFGIKTIVFVIAITIILLSLIVKGRRIVALVWICIIVLLFLFFYTAAFKGGPKIRRRTIGEVIFSKDSKYAYIEVRDKSHRGMKERVLFMDGLIHNRYDPENPDNLVYDYEKIFSAFTKYFTHITKKDEGLTTLTLGGGAFVFPSFLERHYQRSVNEVVEIDPEVVEVAHEYFDLPKDTTIHVYTCDARSYVYSIRDAAKYDLVFLDAFNSFSVPSHLTTKEFTELIKGILNNPGYFVVNCVDIFKIGKFLNAYLNTLAEVFPYYYVYSASGVVSNRRDTFVIIAGNREIETNVLEDVGSSRVFLKVDHSELEALAARNGSLVLTDDHAPVENLMAPVFLKSVD
ncbi:MAG: fused MFS/spermidine synthase [Spirochaetota bacterium]|nr:MAG: fused MFS/spermidine synthase [Spirochaetota bacterium]